MGRTAAVVLFGLALTACSFHTDQFTGDAAPPPVEVGFAQRNSLQDEASNNIEVIVRLSRPAPEPITVGYQFAGGSAVIDQDYTATADGTLSFETGETEKSIPLTILPDAVEEEDETIEITLSSPTGGAEIATGMHTITISHAMLPRVGFSLLSSEGGESGTVTLNVTLDTAPLLASTVTIAPKMNTSAIMPYDYSMPSNMTITFPVGSVSQTIDIPITTDSMNEDDESFVIELAATTNVVIDPLKKERTHTIHDDDLPPTVTIMTASGSTTEGNTGTKQVNLMVVLSGSSSKNITVPVTYGGGTATEGAAADYTYTAKTDLVFLGNQNPALGETQKTIQININGDTTDEEDSQTIITTLLTPTTGGATLGTAMSQTQTITDDDMAPTIVFSTNDMSISEDDSGTKTTTYNLTISAVSERIITFDIALTGAATIPMDYSTSPAAVSGTVSYTVNPGETTTKIDLIVVGDNIDEGPDEKIVMDIVGTSLVNVRAGTPASTQKRTHTIDDMD